MTESPPRIKLDIDLDAPTIILPRLSSSHDVVVLILGNLKVNNVITGNIQHSKIIMDNMDVKLTEMKFGIGRVDDNTEIASMCNILKPLTFVISIKRNLTFGIVKDLPEVALDAHIPSIELDMSEEDYTTLMQVCNTHLSFELVVTVVFQTLSGNLAEGKDVAPNKISTDISNESCILDFKDDLEIEMKASKSKVDFQFRIDMIIAVLYTGLYVCRACITFININF
uniref:VPS13_mid_rpt domain-containing protein n=1 Tax=Heterorhabditis bacteriophora TaxID=37862 RepID=A0A1I7W7J9_HETBA